MKKIVLAMAIFALVACKPDPVAELVADYEQTVFDSKVDLSFKLIESNKLRDILVSDSLPEYRQYLDTKTFEKIEQIEGMYADPKDSTRRVQMIELYRTDYKGTFLEPYYLQIKEWETMGESTKLGELWEVKYSIKNPMLNNAEQELTNRYVISPDQTFIIQKVEE